MNVANYSSDLATTIAAHDGTFRQDISVNI